MNNSASIFSFLSLTLDAMVVLTNIVFVSALQSVTKMEPPMFIRELQDIQCHDGDSVEMVVEVKGSILLIVKQNFFADFKVWHCYFVSVHRFGHFVFK